jgi:SEC-C motif-containing protein
LSAGSVGGLGRAWEHRAVTSDACPCGTGRDLADCCGRFLAGRAEAPTAEQLMRSRYTAFARGDAAYLTTTWHPGTRPRRVVVDPRQRWVGLDVLAVTGGGMLAAEGTVEFVARSERDGVPAELHEVSAFTKVGGAWRYVGPADASV